MLTNRKNLLILLGFLILCGVAIAGWVRTSGAPAQTAAVTAAPNQPYAQPALSATTASYQQPASYQPAVYSEDGYYSAIQRPICVHPANEYVQQQPQPAYEDQPPAAAPPVIERRYVGRNYYGRPVYETRHRRSTGKSVAIVAGSAGAGAAIGAIAGGGKGAAIGGLSGGAAGFIYDRLTHNH